MRFVVLIFFIKAYDVGTHLNPVEAIQMSTKITHLYKEPDKSTYM